MRWPGVLTAAADAATAAWVFRQDAGRTAVAAGAAALIYAGGVVLNDAVDAERDRTLHPDRPLPSGEVGRGPAALFGCLLLAGGVGLAALEGKAVLLAFAGVGAAVLLYDFVLKRVGILGPVGMALCRGGSVLAAGRAGPFPEDAAAGAAEAALLWPLLWAGYAAVITGISVLEDSPDPARARRLRNAVREGVFGFLLLDAAVLAVHALRTEAAAAAALWALLRFALRRGRS